MGYLSSSRERLLHTRSRVKKPPCLESVVAAADGTAPTDDDKKMFADLVADIRKRQISASENFDKSVLTLSSGGLAVSLGFLKDFVPIGEASAPWMLYISWSGLTAATVLTMLSFLASARAQAYQQEAGEAYYMRGDESKLNKKALGSSCDLDEPPVGRMLHWWCRSNDLVRRKQP
jgi:hypothetical protein